MLDIGIRSWEFRTNSQRGFCLLLGPQKRWNIADYHYICLVARELDQTGKLRLAERVESVPKVLDVIVLLRQASLKYFVEHLYNWETAPITIRLPGTWCVAGGRPRPLWLRRRSPTPAKPRQNDFS